MGIDKFVFAAKIVKYWYLIEFLNQPNFPVENKDNKRINRNVADCNNNKRKKITIYHTFNPQETSPTAAFEANSLTYPQHAEISDEISICIGKVKRGECDEYLKRRFNLEDDSIEKDYSKICLVGLKCNHQGGYIEKSLSISPLIWGMARLQNHTGKVSDQGLAELLSLDDYSRDMSTMEDQLICSDTDGNRSGQLLSSELLQQLFGSVFQKYILPLFGVSSSVTSEGVIIYRRYQSEEEKAKDNDSLYFSDLSKSFFTNDLQMIINSNILRRSNRGSDAMQWDIVDYSEV